MVLVNAIKPLASAFLVIVLFLCIFAIGGLNVWAGMMRKRCMDLYTGVIDASAVCGNTECKSTEVCVETESNPFDNSVSYDDIAKSFIVTFQCVTLQGWTDIMTLVERAFSIWGVVYFLPLVFLGAFLFLNLTLAVVQMKFSSTMEKLKSSKALHLRSSHFSAITYHYESDDPLDTSTRRHSLQESQAKAEDLDSPSKVQRMSVVEEPSASSVLFHKRGLSDRSISGVEPPDPSFRSDPVSDPLNASIAAKSDDELEEQMSLNNGSGRTDLNWNLSRSWEHAASKLPASSRTGEYQSEDGYIDLTRVQISELVKDKWLRGLVLSSKQDDPTKQYSLRYYFTPPQESHTSEREVLGRDRSFRPIVPPKSVYFIYDPGPEEIESPFSRFPKFQKDCSKYENDTLDLFFSVVSKAGKVVNEAFQRDFDCGFTLGGWSAAEVNPLRVEKLSPGAFTELKFRLWSNGWKKHCEKLSFSLRKIIESDVFTLAMVAVVTLNTLVLTLYYYGIDDSRKSILDTANLAFTVVLTAEVAARLLAFGPVAFFRDPLNSLDTFVVTLSLVEIEYFSHMSSSSALRAVRILRAFRVFKVVRFFRYLRSISTVLEVLARASIRSMYLVLLLILFTIIFALIGRQLFETEMPATTDSRAAFDTFFHAFLTVFQVLTIDNWNGILYRAMGTSVGEYSFIYFAIWIFIGNFVLLNLFLAILLDAFSAISKEKDEIAPAKKLPIKCTTKMPVPAIPLASRKRNSQLIDLMAHAERQHSDSFDEIREQLRRTTSIEDPWVGIEEEKSCFLFGKTSPVRLFALKLTQSSHFELMVLICIFLNCGELVWETTIINEDAHSLKMNISRGFNIFFTTMFSLEAAFRSVAQGFVLSEGAYLRDMWNVADFLIAIVSIVELNFVDVNLSYVKVIRAMRTIRALRMISRNVSMKLVVQSLLQSILAIFNAALVLAIIWVIFAILGVSMFGGKFRTCSGLDVSTKDECEYYGHAWKNESFNFDDTFQALMSLFVLGTCDNWSDLMYMGIDGLEENVRPQRDANPAAAVYFIAYIFVTSFFLMNVFIGLLIDRFQEVKRQEGTWTGIFLNAKQLKWIKLQELIPKAKVTPSNPEPISPFRRSCYRIAVNSKFELSLMLCIALNMVSLSCPYYGMGTDYSNALEIVNLLFTCIFLFEAMIKLFAFGCKSYFSQTWNKFDFFVVLSSLVEIVLSNVLSSQAKLLRIGPQVTRIARVLRISRLFRLARSLSDLQSLLQAVIYALPSVLNVFSLLILIYFVYAVLGVFLFYDLGDNDNITTFMNFRSFPRALILVIRMSTGESWSQIMRDCAAFSPWAAYPYFYSYIIITNYLMLNLFVMVMIQSVEDHFDNPESYVDLYTRTMVQFQASWRRHCSSEYKIHYRSLLNFMYDLGPPLGEETTKPKTELIKDIITIGIPMDTQGYIFFHELLFCLFRRAFGSFKLDPKKEKLLLYLINKEEIKTLKEIGVTKRKIQLVREASRVRMMRGEWHISANPFLALLYKRKTFTRWRDYVISRKREKDHHRNMSRHRTHHYDIRSVGIDTSKLRSLKTSVM